MQQQQQRMCFELGVADKNLSANVRVEEWTNER